MRRPYRYPGAIDDLPEDTESDTPQSDALIMPMLLAIQRTLAVLERAPTRRRFSLKRQTLRTRAINSLTKRLAWLMERQQKILDRPPPEPICEEREKALQDLENRIAELVAERCGRPE